MISRKLYLFLFIVLSLLLCAQQSKKNLDSVFNTSVLKPFQEGRFEQSLASAKELLAEYERTGKDTKAINLYIYIANIHNNLFQIKEGMQNLEIALAKNSELNNPLLDAKIHAEIGRDYKLLGFRDTALEEYETGLRIAKGISNPGSVGLQKYIYSLKGVIYEEEQNYNLLYKNLINAHKLAADTYSSSRLAKYHTTYKKNLDSAKFYLDLGSRLYKKDITPIFQYSVLLRNKGRYSFIMGDYQKAVSYLEESLSISKKLDKPQDIRDTHKILYEVYKAMEDQKRSLENLEKYTVIDDSLTAEVSTLQEIPVKKLMQEKHNIIKSSRNTLYIWLIGICIISFLVILPLVYNYNKKRKESRKIINSKISENLVLQKKVNLVLDDVVTLAKKNSPEFWAKFQEAYPEFNNKMLIINPDLKKSELILCAYIFLGFNTKDIAEYSFKAIKTIKNNKYNLRKRLNVPTKDDFVVWLRAQLEG